MNQRDLSEKLEELARKLDDGHDRNEIAAELRKLSNENYAPGASLSWDAVKPKPMVKKTGGFISNKTGKKMPF